MQLKALFTTVMALAAVGTMAAPLDDAHAGEIVARNSKGC